MSLTLQPHPALKLLVAAGRIDQNSADGFLAELQRHLADCGPDTLPILLDFSGVDYISSVGLRALMVASRQVKASRGKIAIAALQPLVKEVFGIARFDLVIPCFESVEAACAGLAP